MTDTTEDRPDRADADPAHSTDLPGGSRTGGSEHSAPPGPVLRVDWDADGLPLDVQLDFGNAARPPRERPDA